MLGDNLLALIKAMDYRGIPIPIVQRITKQVRPLLQPAPLTAVGLRSNTEAVVCMMLWNPLKNRLHQHLGWP